MTKTLKKKKKTCKNEQCRSRSNYKDAQTVICTFQKNKLFQYINIM